MNGVRKILGRLYAFYFLLLFVVLMLILLIPLYCCWLLKDPARTRGFIILGRIWMFFFMPLAGCPVRRRGTEYFQEGQTYVVVCNHNSFADVLVSTSMTPGIIKTLAKTSMGNIPVFGPIYRLGAILVDRHDEESRKQSYQKMKAALDMGMHMLLYPEGTRNRTEEPLKPFYDGAFSLAIDKQVPIMPAVLFNTRKIIPAGGFYAEPHKITLDFLPPIDTKGMTRDQVPALKEKVFHLIRNHYVKGGVDG